MANQIESPKIVAYAITGPVSGSISASKVVMYLLLEPGTDGSSPDTTNRQGHVYSRMIRRD